MNGLLVKKRKRIIDFNENDKVISKISKIRGIENIDTFLDPPREVLHNPRLLKNIKPATERIVQTIENGERIALHGDIDSDGANSTAIMYRYLSHFTSKLTYFHAQRSEGHGVQLRKDDIPEGTNLLIVLDSSSNEWETCKEISERGIDIIIIDHHEVTVENKYCILLNDKQTGCEYPNKDTSGSLLTWKVCQVLDEHFNTDYAETLIDLAGVGLHSDQMSMMSLENRYIVKQTLDNIRSNGLKAILKVLKKDLSNLNSNDLAYGVTPFINAATRLDKIESAIELLISEDEQTANRFASELYKMNEERKKRQKKAIERIVPTIDESDRCIVIVDETLGKNMNGLIASDLCNKYQRPIIVLGKANDADDEYHGSFRAPNNFNFLEFVSTIPIITHSGGHAPAGGVGIKKDDLIVFKKLLNKKLKNEKFNKETEYDLIVELSELNEKFIKNVMSLSKVCGNGFPEPMFFIRNLHVSKKETLGKNADTLKASLFDESATWFMSKKDLEKAKPSLVGMRFRQFAEHIEEFPVGANIDVVGTLNLNEWKKFKPKFEIVKTKQVFIEDYQLSK